MDRRAALGWISLLLVPLLAGCMGPTSATASSVRFQPYTHYAHVTVPGVGAREPACDDQGRCTEYYLVRLLGSENATLVSGPDVLAGCHKDWLFDVNPGNHSVVYNAKAYASLANATVNTLVAEEFWGIAFTGATPVHGCPTTYALNPYPRTPPPTHNRLVGSYGMTELKVYRDGTIALGTQSVFGIGTRLIVSYGRLHSVGSSTYFVTGGFQVENLGPWPLANLEPGAGTLRQ